MSTELRAPIRQPQAEGDARRAALRAFALLAPVAVVALLVWIHFRSYDRFMLALDHHSALGPCRSATGVRPLCDFANHYYPQGQALVTGPTVVPGFYYSAFFALCMRGLATFSYPVARTMWGAVVTVAALALLLAPLTRTFRFPLVGCVAYGFLFATSLPVWHDLAFGQVSAITTVLILLALLAGDSGRPTLSGLLIGVAASIKFYPALFLVYFLLRRQFRTVVVALTTSIICMGVLPWLFFGDAGLLTFHRALWAALNRFSGVVATTPFSSFIANAVTHLALGRVDPTAALYSSAIILGLLLSCFHVFLAWRSIRIEAKRGLWTGLTLGFVSIPLLVRSCWVHYFVFLPLLQGSILQNARGAVRPRSLTLLVLVSVAISASLVSAPALFLLGGDSYYQGALPFWATLVLLPALYSQVLADR